MKIIELILDNLKVILLAAIVILIMLLARQCESTKEAKSEITRITNNNLALNDTIKNYIDENGLLTGKIRGLHLKIDELGDSIQYEKNKPPVTVISYVTEIKDTIIIAPTIDTFMINPDGTFIHLVTFNDTATWGKSSRKVGFEMPVWLNDSAINTGKAELTLNQNIWLNAGIQQDVKTKEVFVELKTDYPGITFNDAQGILIKRDEAFKKFSREQRKQFGLGLHLGAGFNGDRIGPYIGIGVHYSPKFLQW